MENGEKKRWLGGPKAQGGQKRAALSFITSFSLKGAVVAPGGVVGAGKRLSHSHGPRVFSKVKSLGVLWCLRGWAEGRCDVPRSAVSDTLKFWP